METDAVVGDVLDALEQSRLAANTLVLLTSDNGCAPYIGVEDLETMGHFPSGPLQGYKSDVWEGGHLMPLLRGSNQPIRKQAISHSLRGEPSLRLGSWKYIPAPGSGGWSDGPDPTYPVQLYNLEDDLGETTNLAAEDPERVAQMQALLDQLIDQGRSTSGPRQFNDVEVVRFPDIQE